ncbi:MAG: RHS repeat-associated core domain-containing protein [Propionicimonas sp.]|uniref:RHS repeat-associated core domain-containing protein n=1 Tax=Propionicimonas sp. TaxID=1955623 RepID=UPI003D0B4E81
MAQAGTTPIRIGTPAGTSPAANRATVTVLDRQSSDKLVGPGVVAKLQTAPGSVQTVSLDYSGFADASGAGYGSRLRLVALPECALTTPDEPQCQTQTDLGAVNDTQTEQLTATITAPAGEDSNPSAQPTATTSPSPTETAAAQPTATEATQPTATASATSSPSASSTDTTQTADTAVMVLAAVASTSSDQGDYGATSLKPSSSWSAGGSSGDFHWTYPLRVPAVPSALTPNLVVSYSSGGTDGGVSNTNNQASWVGEGFELSNSFIERKYAGCYDDRSGASNKSSNAVDLCWYTDSKKTNDQPWDNAFLSMDGHSGELVRDGNTANWRLEADDGTRVAKIGNTTDNNEYWRVTTPDGTQYFFGKGKSDATSAAATNSVWSVPVAANNSGEPGYSSTFSKSFKQRPWRWNLDYVVSPTGTTVTYTYAKEANKYKENLSTSTSYDRGGYLASIQYGERQGSETSDGSPAKVTFTVEERCDTTVSSSCKTAAPKSSTAKAWPDVPMDAYCQSDYCPSEKTSPTFFSRKRLSQIDTYTRNAAGTGWDTVDSWSLAGSFPAPADGGATPSLWLASITHTGKAGTAISTPAVTLTPAMLDSRISGSSVALEKPRLAVVTAETGAQTIVTYADPECTASTVPTTAQIPTNTTRCMPVWYSDGTADPSLQWFNKYVVKSVTVHDPVAASDVNLTSLNLDISADQVTSYTYTGGAAWRYSDSPMIKTKYRTWGEWRGYGRVTTVSGSGATQDVSEDTFFRGMNGDRANDSGGTKTVTVTDSTGATWPDDDWLSGITRESRTLTAAGGTEDSGTITDPHVTTGISDGRLTSRQIGTAKTVSRQKLATGGTRTGIDTTLAWDSYGQPTESESQGDTSVTGDETCTRTSYAAPSNTATGPIDKVAETSTMPALCSTGTDQNQVLTATRHYYGTAAYTDPVAAPALETKTQKLTGSGTSRAWTTTGTSTYDQWGRVTSATDSLGNTTTTTFTQTTGGLLSTMATTTPDPDGSGTGTPLTTTITYDTRWNSPVKTVDAGGQITEAAIDALGRITSVWKPGRDKATQTATTTYAYTISNTAPSSVTTKTLLPNGTDYSTSVELVDSLLRTRQVQSQAAISGRLISDTRYDSRGNAVLEDSYYNSDAPSSTLVQPTVRTSILNSHRYTFDFADRQTRDAFYSAETYKWQTLSSYGGDRTDVTPPNGGTPTTTVTDIQGRTTQLTQHLGTDTNATGITTSYTYDPAGNLTRMSDTKGNKWDYTYDLSGNKLTASDPDKGLTTMSYNTGNQLTSTTDARGTTLKYFYDNLGRATKTTKGDGTTVLTDTVYDTVKKGLVTSTSRHLDGGTITNRVDSYDNAGRATSTTTVVPQIDGLIGSQLAGSYTSTTTYNADGSTNSQTLPAAGPVPAETLTYGYTATGLPKTLTGTLGSTTATYVTNTYYLQWASLSGLVLGTQAGNAIMTSYSYDLATMRLTGTQLNREVSPGVTDEHTDLGYDNAGNVTQVKATEADGQVDNQCFSYDYQQQLTEAWTPNTATCDTAARSQANLSGPSPYWTSWTTGTTGKTASRTDRTKTTSSTTTYSYPNDGASSVTPHFITGTTTTGSATGTGTYSADQAGNTTSRPGADGNQQTLVWDDTNQLTQVKEGAATVARMVYDASGNRIIRQEKNTTTLYLGGTELTVTGSGTQPPQTGGTTTLTALRYYSHAGKTLAVRTGASNDTVTILIPDWQGTTHQQVNNTTGAVQTTWQDPYGQTRGTAPTTWTGERGFVGGTKDATGLTRVGARDYDPALGRFITVDPVQDASDPLQWNPYLYANNTPVTQADPTGQWYRMCIDTCNSKADRAANRWLMRRLAIAAAKARAAAAARARAAAAARARAAQAAFFRLRQREIHDYNQKPWVAPPPTTAPPPDPEASWNALHGGNSNSYQSPSLGNVKPVENVDPNVTIQDALVQLAGGVAIIAGVALLAAACVGTGGLACAAESVAAGTLDFASGGSVAGGVSLIGTGARIEASGADVVASAESPLVRLSSEESWANPNTLADHFARHGGDFGANSADEYAQMASEFLQRSGKANLPTKIGPDGTIRIYDPASNTFGSFSASGQTKTFFKPTSATYWDRQPGTMVP